MKWNDLSLKNKAELMKIYIKHGYTSLDDIINHYNNFQDGGQIEGRGIFDETNRIFNLSDKGANDVNRTYFSTADGGQDPQAILTYNGARILPEITITPYGNYIHNTHDNIFLKYNDGGQLLAPHLFQIGGTTDKKQSTSSTTTTPVAPPTPPFVLPNFLGVQDNTYYAIPYTNAELMQNAKDYRDHMIAEALERQPKFMPYSSNEKEQQNNDSVAAINMQKDFIHDVENASNKGYDTSSERYYSYSATEDGGKTQDIGDGLKLTKDANPELLNIYNSQIDENGKHYITKEQHDEFVSKRFAKDYNDTREAYNKHIGSDTAWDELNYKEKAFLMDYQYNVKGGGVSSFPNLMTAINNKDIEAIIKESKRYSVKKVKNGKKIRQELGRNKYMEERALELYSD